MSVKETVYERKSREWHERSRAEDARRLAAGEVTPDQLQEENSFIPRGTRITLPRENLRRFMLKFYNY